VRSEEGREAPRLVLVDGHGRFGSAGLVPDAEADVVLVEIARDAERLAVILGDRDGRGEELDELAPLRRRASGAEAEARLDGATTFGARGHGAIVLPRRGRCNTFAARNPVRE